MEAVMHSPKSVKMQQSPKAHKPAFQPTALGPETRVLAAQKQTLTRDFPSLS